MEEENNMFVLRLASFIVLVGLFLYCVLGNGQVPGWIFSAFAASAAGMVMYEASSMLEKIDKKSFKYAFAIFSSVLIFCFSRVNIFMIGVLAISFFCICFWFGILKSADKKEYFEKFCNSAGLFTILVLPLIFLVFIYRINPFLLLFVVAVTKIGDTGAYCVGMTSNIILKGKNHKIVPSISPKKSWEGTIGGLICSIIMSICLWPYTPLTQNPDEKFSIMALICGIILFIGGFCGDLTESVLKRICGVKDSANYIPGMGGVFDFLDSMLLNSVIFTVFWILYTLMPYNGK